jgi:hypothetical protein
VARRILAQGQVSSKFVVVTCVGCKDSAQMPLDWAHGLGEHADGGRREEAGGGEGWAVMSVAVVMGEFPQRTGVSVSAPPAVLPAWTHIPSSKPSARARYSTRYSPVKTLLWSPRRVSPMKIASVSPWARPLPT